MLYALTPDEAARLRRRMSRFDSEYPGAEMLHAVYRTDPAVLAEIVPRPLRPAEEARALAFVARYPETNFGCRYEEAALFVEVRFGLQRGFYCLAMPVTDDMALVNGRETYGFPKKLAERITLERSGTRVVGSVLRKGTELLRIEASLAGAVAPAELALLGDAALDGAGRPCRQMTAFNYKCFPRPDLRAFEGMPRLVRAPVLCRARPGLQRATARVVVRSTAADPLGEVPVLGEPLACTYGVWDLTLVHGRSVAREWLPWRALRYSAFKNDAGAVLLEPGAPESSRPATPSGRAAR